MRALFLVANGAARGMARKYRVDVYQAFLQQQGFKCTILSSFPSKDFTTRPSWLNLRRNFRLVYFLALAIVTTVVIVKRLIDICLVPFYDIVFLQRDFLPVPLPPFLEALIAHLNGHMVFDFDDAIFLPYEDRTSFLQSTPFYAPNRIGEIVKMSSLTIAGNSYLADFARKHNPNVIVIPTPIDTDRYLPPYKETSDRIVIGWSGTRGGIPYLETLGGVFDTLLSRYDKLEIHILTDIRKGESSLQHPRVFFHRWTNENEIEQLSKFDIGLMPLPDTEWTKGKCALKALSYMAMGIPTVLSPIGMNNEVVEDGVSGFFANTREEWIEKLSRLIDDAGLRKRLGDAGRATVLARYSLRVLAPRLEEALREVACNKDNKSTSSFGNVLRDE